MKYKLIKEYPGSCKLGGVAVFGNHGLSGRCYQVKNKEGVHRFERDAVENNPEFWEKVEEVTVVFDTIEKTYYRQQPNGKWRNYGKLSNAPIDKIEYSISTEEIGKVRYILPEKMTVGYKILTMKSEGGTDYNIVNNNLEECIKNYKGGHSILSVERLSDGEVFSIGDKISATDDIYVSIYTDGKISEEKSGVWAEQYYRAEVTGFKLIDGHLIVIYDSEVLLGQPIEFVKKRKLVFTTEDGVDIFDEDKTCWVNRHFEVSSMGKNRGVLPKENYKYFSSKKAAEEYVIMNKPSLCLKDIVDKAVSKQNPFGLFTIHIDDLKALIKIINK